jgi:nitric oxide reductase subunit B
MKRLWLSFAAVIVLSFAVLLWVGSRIYQEAPPVPAKVLSTDGQIVIPENDIAAGQNVWQSIGGMEVGSIWGHGSYVAPDWSADWLHREAVFILDELSTETYAKKFEDVAEGEKALLEKHLQAIMRTNTFDANAQTITVPPVRARAIAANIAYYSEISRNGRDAYAIPKGALTDETKLRQLASFFFWSSWAASTNRPNDVVSYTSNWPHEELVANKPTSDSIVWTGVSIIFLLGGIGGMSWYYAMQKREHSYGEVPANDPLLGHQPTPSQRAIVKYFWVVSGLILLQIIMGVITAHYGVEGNAFYGIPLAKILPYSVSRTWHTQLGIFWIATAWLAAGLYIAPAVGGFEPKGQRLGVNVLFGALLVVVLGSMAGEWMSIMQLLPDNMSFLFGHSGYEYIDLGKIFQIALFVGLLLWLYLVARAIMPALKRKDEQRTILTLFLISAIAIAGFYSAAFGVGKHTNLAIAEYWRWWVVHLWVEGFFEVFATVVIAFLFARLKLISLKTAGRASLLSSAIFLAGGIIGTLHHLYFSGTPTLVLAFGSVFSALEVVPLSFVAFEAWENLRLTKASVWVQNYKWPIYYFVAVAFWNMVGAGIFGFMINPPIALYYMQGLNTTPVHAHAALFGVYGMLGIGLMLFCLRALRPEHKWKEGPVKFSFWAINIGLFVMIVFSLLPVGLRQTWASVEYGYWYARSSEFLQTDLMNTLRWLRIPGDTIFAIGSVVLVIFIVGLGMGFSLKKEKN